MKDGFSRAASKDRFEPGHDGRAAQVENGHFLDVEARLGDAGGNRRDPGENAVVMAEKGGPVLRRADPQGQRQDPDPDPAAHRHHLNTGPAAVGKHDLLGY